MDSINGLLKQTPMFDAIICDPPYGWRASARESGVSDRQKIRKERLDELGFKKRELDEDEVSYKSTKVSEMDKIVQGLFELAKKILVVGGRLVFLYPIHKEEYCYFIILSKNEPDFLHRLPKHESFEYYNAVENKLTPIKSRILISMRRIK